jgi:hypothetical protein
METKQTRLRDFSRYKSCVVKGAMITVLPDLVLGTFFLLFLLILAKKGHKLILASGNIEISTFRAPVMWCS